MLNSIVFLAPVAAVAGYCFPYLFTPFREAIVPLLMLIMLSMGLTLRGSDFLEVGKLRAALCVGVVMQFLVMPLTALMISHLLQLSDDLTVGMVLVGSVAGGTSSNVMTFLAKGNVALSICMTATSTLGSVLLTPLLLRLLVGSVVDVPTWEMLGTLLWIILTPVTVGVILRGMFGESVAKIQPHLPVLAVITILIIIACVVALNEETLVSSGPKTMLAALLHNVTGLLLGYSAAIALRYDGAIARTIAIEVGMQNSGLATALALKYFSPAAALPGAAFSVWLNITGAVFARMSQRRDAAENAKDART